MSEREHEPTVKIPRLVDDLQKAPEPDQVLEERRDPVQMPGQTWEEFQEEQQQKQEQFEELMNKELHPLEPEYDKGDREEIIDPTTEIVDATPTETPTDTVGRQHLDEPTKEV